MQRVVIDLERLKVLHCGLGQYSLHLGRAIRDSLPEHLAPIFLVPKSRQHLITDDHRQCLHVAAWRKEKYVRLARPFVPQRLRHAPFSLWHVTNQHSKFLPFDPHVPVVLTIHDLNFLRDKPPTTIDSRLRRLQRRVDRAAAVTTISTFSANDIREHLHLGRTPLHVIYNGTLIDTTTAPDRPDFLPPGKFLFSIGEFRRSKNFHVLLDLVKKLPEYRLVVAGDNDNEYGRSLLGCVAEFGLQDRVFFPGTVSDGVRNWLYQHCDAMLFPSLTEGFGLPIVEAMSFGKPVFMTACTSLPEVGGAFGFYWESFDADHMHRVFVEGMKTVAASPDFYDASVAHANQFSWQAAAKRYVQVYEEVLQNTEVSTGKRNLVPAATM